MRRLPLIPQKIPLKVTIKANKALLLIIAAGALAVLTTIMQFSAAQSAPDLTRLKEKRDQLKKEITALNSDPKDLKCEADSDCDYVELGAKPCGGPWEFIVFSKKSDKASAVKRKAGEYTALDKQINEAEQAVSNCEIVLPPEVRCKDSICVDAAATPAPSDSPAQISGKPTGKAAPAGAMKRASAPAKPATKTSIAPKAKK